MRKRGRILLGALLALLALATPVLAQEEGEDDRETFQGTLTYEGEPVAGVAIRVETQDGEPVGEAASGEDGTWAVPVPAPGEYRITLEVETLPEDVELRDPDRATLEATIRPGQDRTLLFPLGEGTAAIRGFWAELIRATTNGLKFGFIIAMTAIGLSLIFGTTGLINFSHGEMVTFGAIVAFYLNVQGPQWHLLYAAVIAIAAGGLLGGVMERGLWRPLRDRKVGLFQMLVISIGFMLVLRHVLLIFFGGRSRPFAQYAIQSPWQLGPVRITPRDLAIIVLSLLILVGVAVLLERTRMGKAMRAVADNRDLAESSGIDVRRVVLLVWISGGALAATGGVFLGTVENVSFLMGFRLLLLMFAGVILGGLGTAYGAMVGSLVVGLVTELSTLWFSAELKFVWALLALIVILLIRPQGILGLKERIG